jgi:putative endonuclease
MATEEQEVGIPTDPRRQFGNRGEDLAAAFFMARGFRVVMRNWSCRLGEIDLVVEKAGMVHFVEVKTRRSMTYGYPEEAITRSKLRHLARAIEVYLAQTGFLIRHYQADALAITVLEGKAPEYHFVEAIL